MRRKLVWLRVAVAAFLVVEGWPLMPCFAQQAEIARSDALTDLGPSGLSDLTKQVEMTLEQAKLVAMDNNPDLENARRDLRLAELEIVRARAGYDPYFQVDSSYSSSRRPTSQSVFGTTNDSASVNLSTGVSTITGGNLSLDFRNSRSESDSAFSTLNPSYSTDLTLNVRQPLLKNRFNDTLGMDLQSKNNDLARSSLALESKIYEIEAQVEDSYWSLVRSRMDLTLKRNSLAMSEWMDRMTKAQVTAGVSPSVATLQTEANVASARSALIRSENDYRKAQASLKMTLNVIDEDFWVLEIIPTDLPAYEAPEFDRDQLLNEAMANNIALRQTRLSIANQEITNRQTENRVQPQLDLRGSVGVSGLAGTDNPSDQVVPTGFVVPNPLPPNLFPQPYILETTVSPGSASQYEGDYGDAVNNMLEGDNLSWSAGITFNVPIGNRSAKTDLERSRISYEKMLDDLNNQRRQVFLNLINLIYDLEAAHRGFISAREAANLQLKNLETEEKKYTLGLNTSYEVMQARESYEEAVSGEIGALIEYTKALGRMDRARKGYVTAAGSSSIPLNLPSGISGLSSGSLPAGVDASMIQQYSSMLPAGVDINSLMGLMP